MKARPILFSTPMVEALLEGRKTQTRRIVNFGLHPDGNTNNYPPLNACPYGNVGDLLWVRETFWENISDKSFAWYETDVFPIDAKRDDVKRKPSIFMPKWASRLTLEITGIRIERLQDITNADSIEEGTPDYRSYFNGFTMKDCYRKLWQSINGEDSWLNNPWVWVIEFKVHKCNFQELVA